MSGLCLLGPVAYFQIWTMAGRVATVEPERLYRAAELPADRLVALCRRYDITTVLDFRTDPQETAAEAAALRRAGIAHVNLPTGQVPSPDTVERFLHLMDQTRGEGVLIHCTHGFGRTGVFSAIYRMEYQGWSPRRAMFEQIVAYGAFSFLPGTAKGTFLSNYRPHRTPKPEGPLVPLPARQPPVGAGLR